MEFEMINGISYVKHPDPNTEDTLAAGAIPVNPQDMSASQILSLVAGLISALDDAENKMKKVMETEIKIEGYIDAMPGLSSAIKKALDKQVDALIEKQQKLIDCMKELQGVAAGIEASGCKITSTSNPLELLTQAASKDLKKVQELMKEAKALLSEISKVALLGDINAASLPWYIQTSLEELQKTGDKADKTMDQTLQSLSKAIEDDVKKLTQSIQNHLLTHPPETAPSQTSPSTHK